ncbi:MAG TPA: choice-of-anchor V domain-containing protein [Candidatus Thermoplasmatota archaeon]
MRAELAALRAAAVVCLVALAAAALPAGLSNDEGVFDAQERGCYCHGVVTAPTVGFSVDGLPGRYTPGATYRLWINVTFTDVPAAENRSQGGFYVNATAGSFAAPAGGGEPLVQVRGNEATHTLNGSLVRRWVVEWTAPAEPGLEVTFWFFVNTVNGNRSETLGSDHWTLKTIRIGIADAPVVEGPPQPVAPQALETYGALALGVAAALVALYFFASSARRGPPAGVPREPEGTPESGVEPPLK